MKKALSMVLLISLCFSLCACSNSGKTDISNEKQELPMETEMNNGTELDSSVDKTDTFVSDTPKENWNINSQQDYDGMFKIQDNRTRFGLI